ncbi:MAG: Rrf2 family transcriptional regulator [Firmicutes bacterium]|nr:Rrf2 family transcriptional regulator [Bacillota bacterium]
MKISTRGRYGLRAMIDLAASGDGACVTLKSIAGRQGISENYLEQLISPLKKAGYVKSVRGSLGGYALNKPAAGISVGDILRILEGDMYPVGCLSDDAAGSCGKAGCGSCVTKPVWQKMYDSVNDVLESFSLADLARDYVHIQVKEGAGNG